MTGLQDDFLLVLRSEADTTRGFSSLYQAKLLIEDIVADFSSRYVERLGEDAYFGALLGGLSGIQSGLAELYYIHPQGYGEAVPYRCSGHGADYAHSLAKYLLTPDVPLEDSAYRAAFVISWVSEEIDSTVGGTPQVAMIRDQDPRVTYLDSRDVGEAGEHAEQTRAVLPELFNMPPRDD